MRIETRPLTEVEFARYNPRKELQPGDDEWERIEKSIDTFGLVQPLVLNERTGRLVGGHQRAKILLARGETHAEFVLVDLDEPMEKALNVALNNPDIGGVWDNEKLNELLFELEQHGFDVTLTGFDTDDLERRLGAHDTVGGGALDETELLESHFEIIVTCSDEMQQTELLQRLTEEGFTCRALVS